MSPRQRSSAGGMHVSPARGRILILDSDPAVVQSVSPQLTALGFETVIETSSTAWSPGTAAALDFNSLSGILLELQSQTLSGLARLLQEIQSRHSAIPIIVMSEASNIARLRKAVELGASEYLVKPVDAELFKRKCLQVFSCEHRT